MSQMEISIWFMSVTQGLSGCINFILCEQYAKCVMDPSDADDMESLLFQNDYQ